MSVLALPVVPTPNADPGVDMGTNPNANPAQPTPMGSLHDVGGIQLANQMPENLAPEIPARQNVQEPTILLEHTVPNRTAPPHSLFVQPFAPVQTVPAVAMDVAVTVAVVAQPFVPAANDNPAQQPLLCSLCGFQGTQFEDENEGEDDLMFNEL
ncbi:hypothetical protein FRC10_004856, partial [Ceratobasidium sp. 414]